MNMASCPDFLLIKGHFGPSKNVHNMAADNVSCLQQPTTMMKHVIGILKNGMLLQATVGQERGYAGTE